MAWTTPRTWSTGELVTKAIMDPHVRDNLAFLYPAQAVCETATAQTFTTAVVTIVRYDTVVTDPDSDVTTGAAWKYTATFDGLYAVDAALLWEASTAWSGAAAETSELQLFKNGAQNRELHFVQPPTTGAGAGFVQLQGSAMVRLAATDTIDIRAVQRTGGNLSLFNNALHNYVCICRLSG